MGWNNSSSWNNSGLKTDAERKAFNAGYSDGYHNYPKYSGNERGHNENAYTIGYEAGKKDRE